MRTLFFGSDAFALEPLDKMLTGRHEVAAVVGMPDRRAGRGLALSPTPLVARARELGLEVFQPESLARSSFAPSLEGLGVDAGVVVAYGGIIPAWLLELPAHGFVNLHPSLLPRYRGAAPVERALMAGASVTGVTTVRMDERLDAGDILLHVEVPIEETDTADTLAARLSHAGASLLVETLDALEDGSLTPVPQEEDKATCAPSIAASEARIDWSLPAENIDRLVRALNPQPGAYTFFRGRRVKVFSARVTDVPPEDEPGTIMNLGKEGFIVNTGSSGLLVLAVQPEGKRLMSASEFSRGQRLLVAESFGPEPEPGV